MGASPQSAAIRSIPWSVRSSSSWARIRRWLVSHWCGVVPVCAANQRANAVLVSHGVLAEPADGGRVPANIVAEYEAANGR